MLVKSWFIKQPKKPKAPYETYFSALSQPIKFSLAYFMIQLQPHIRALTWKLEFRVSYKSSHLIKSALGHLHQKRNLYQNSCVAILQLKIQELLLVSLFSFLCQCCIQVQLHHLVINLDDRANTLILSFLMHRLSLSLSFFHYSDDWIH